MYVTQRGREDDDFGVYVYRSTDFGRTFISIGASVPSGSVNVIREDPTDAIAAFHRDGHRRPGFQRRGKQWHALGGNLPSVQVSDLQYQPRDQVLVISTYGRGMWAMDGRGINVATRCPLPAARSRSTLGRPLSAAPSHRQR